MSPMIQELRREIVEAHIEELIALLDLLDGDPDLEENGDLEPSIGSAPLYVGSKCLYDLEFDDADDEDGGDAEGTLGWSNPSGLRAHIRDEAEQLMAPIDNEEGPLGFDGSGVRIAKAQLKEHKRKSAAVTPSVTPVVA
ncbi:hypothetical protein [Rhizobium phaseoli]|uniref:hypothetical protein n=1 Tax=Rhizobium phaseoli TaxID=396 RepID=UPI0007E92769|nr:hypothetical protein [Rhizobium phaseoli]ANL34087.1 hypothetical protein AMC89_CH02027 [Rhizobium phaseoli]ANL97810.1 hypothetical protein AMC79_CH02020 [Rhizobium phaseoli]